MRASTVARAALVLALASAALTSCKPKEPGQESLEAATRTITAKDGGATHGNTQGCTDRAELLGEVMQRMAAVGFDRDKDASASISGDAPFRVHCEHTVHGVAFLVQVPKLEQYQDEQRTQLARLAWKSSELVTQDLAASSKLPLAVGLHGKAFYGVVLSGQHGSDPEASLEGVASAVPLFPFFGATKAAETPIPEGLVETTRAIVSKSESTK